MKTMRFAEFSLVDYARGGANRRNNVVPIRDAVADARNGGSYDSYITVFRFAADYAEHAAGNGGSVKGYAGTCYADYLPLDIDREGNLTAALYAARGVAQWLIDTAGADPRQLRYFFSGSKGFHLLIPTALFDGIAPSPHLPAAFKAVATRIGAAADERLDLAIYDVNRLFRLPNTQHQSRLWKVELSHAELIEKNAEAVRELARQGPRAFAWEPPHLEPNDLFTAWLAEALEAAATRPERSGASRGGLADAIAEAIRPAFMKGQRHAVVLALAGYAAKQHVPRETMLGVADALLDGELDVEDPDNLPNAINATYDRVRAGDPVKGYTDLIELADADTLAALREAIGDVPKPREGAPAPPVDWPPPPDEVPEDYAPAPVERGRPERPKVPAYDAMIGDRLEDFAREKEAPIRAIPTMWPMWNHACRGAGGGVGLALGWHVVVAARSGNGKSLIGANLAAHAIQHGKRVSILSLEMAQSEMQTRVMAIIGNVPIKDIEHGKHFNREKWKAADRRMQEAYDRGGVLYINRDVLRSLKEIEALMRHQHAEHGVELFLIDYLQLAGVGTVAEIFDRVTEVSGLVRGLAKELGVVTVGMSQLNRESSKLAETPRKEGLMGGSPLENDAEQVLLLDHSRIERILNPTTGVNSIGSWAVLDKNRHGPTADIPTLFNTTTLEVRERLDDEITEHFSR